MKSELPSSNNFSPFWSVFILGLTLVVFLGWQVSLGVRQYLAGVRYGEQQDAIVLQATQAEQKLRALMLDVLTLSASDTETDKIVRKYNIKFTPDESTSGVSP